MWARLTRFVLPALDPEKSIGQLHHVVDVFGAQPGLERVDVLFNRRNGDAVTITVWESEEAMKASEELADHLRSEVALEVLGWVDRVSEYELIRSDTPGRDIA
jgi:heme-degrading monooxygenase HmoA